MKKSKKLPYVGTHQVKITSTIICEMCKNNKEIFCPRNVDAQCLECGENFCGGHIAEHLREEHCISLSFEHCSHSTGRRA